MKALEFSRNELKYAAAAVSARLRTGSGAQFGPLNLVDVDSPKLPDSDWQYVKTSLSGICGSDLATVEGKSPRYFESWVSFPFILGHEITGQLENGQRVVIEPVLGHACRGFEPPFKGAAPGDGDDYSHIVNGHIKPGIQTGYCESTGGGWGEQFMAHASQIHKIPDTLSDEAAVMVEPTAVGVHAALKANPAKDSTVAVQGSGTMGLVTIAALRKYTETKTIIASAKYPEQAQHAKNLGADIVVKPNELTRAVRRESQSFKIGSDLSGGADITIDTIGSANTIQQAISITKPRGKVVMLGIPGKVSLDLTGLWHRETELIGCYTYGTELYKNKKVKTFKLAIDLAKSASLGDLVSAHYHLEDYKDALSHAANAGPRGATKICFDLRN